MKNVSADRKPEGPPRTFAPGNALERKGFTLVELLVIIAVIAILAALLLPALARAKTSALSAKCKSNLRQWGLSLHMYTSDWGDKYPLRSYETNAGVWTYWQQSLEAYAIKWTSRDYNCPGFKGLIGCTNVPNGYTPDSYWPVNSSSYGYNAFGSRCAQVNPHLGLGEDRVFIAPGPFGPPWEQPVPASQVIVPSQMFAIGDSRVECYGSGAEVALNGYGVDALYCGLFSGNMPLCYPPRHGTAYNVVFCDGHVQGMKPILMFNPTNTAPMWNRDHQPHPESW
jgi:prepilin-type N-terminal cleavage/methylation domain-containing protein/prepilin-type processing-associated H-X9-DG protein